MPLNDSSHIPRHQVPDPRRPILTARDDAKPVGIHEDQVNRTKGILVTSVYHLGGVRNPVKAE